MPTVSRRTFLKLSTAGAGALALPPWAERLVPCPAAPVSPTRPVAAAPAGGVCLPQLGMAVPLAVPFLVGEDCAPYPTLPPTWRQLVPLVILQGPVSD